ncbi:hypothetical protein [Streptomyces canus]|uniref:Uncharacterized protein n=1 Tax=Streptomyces canus TaxID=58343 RepID=A0AAW8F3V5_9ACTN|nr:hypothetical protein [Streptomyces canus]MDQ0767224.1 hypothetical protein [Streptomyces canus]MDQ0904726.1 hypothetical protein [Streptomyces canus]MDQ1065279.1 hypothetical protein [Streptomyces canus]
MRQQTTMSGPVNLQLPPEPPQPRPNCDVCAALAKQGQEARDRGDLSAATDADVEIRNHPHRTRGRR